MQQYLKIQPLILIQRLSLIKYRIMYDEAHEPEIFTPLRPVFLKVLCILTFIGSGYGIINNTFVYFKANDISKMMTNAKAKMNDDINKKSQRNPESAGLLSKIFNSMSSMSTPDNLRKTAIGNIVTSVLCLLGAVLMWHLNRTGFYIYTLGTIISIAIPIYLFGNNFITNISAGLAGFIGILFVIFYAMNLKSMQRPNHYLASHP